MIFSFFQFELNSQSQKNQVIQIKNIIPLDSISSYDETFKEFSQITEENYQAIASGKNPSLIFFSYVVTKNDNFFTLCARFSIRQETIATINRISNPTEKLTGKKLIIPTVNGIFIPNENPVSSFETLLRKNYENEIKNKTLTNKMLFCSINGIEYDFILDKRLSVTERAYFLDSTLVLPLPENSFFISSEFGKRRDPFSENRKWKNHGGIDLAVNENTEVYAVKSGKVSFTKENDEIFGNYIILEHDGNLTSVYAHLSKILVEEGKSVTKGQIIAKSGKSGAVTGPHLHFEIRSGGVSQNPENLLNLR